MKNPNIIFQDEQVLVLDKPSGWITNSADTTSSQPVIEKWVSDNFKFPVFACRLCRHGIVHRLDKETSGILIIAKTESSFIAFQKQFKERKVHKTYIALAHGVPAAMNGEVKAVVGRLPWRRDRFGVLPGGREAVTRYSVIQSFQKDQAKYSLLELMPLTGRTHQIRIHLKHIGHPVVSDEFYAGRKTARNDRRWCPRLFLHAKAINLYHPVSGEKINFVSDLPDDLKNAVATLEPLN